MIKTTYQLRLLAVITFVLFASPALATEDPASSYALQNHPVLGKMFSWGMSKEDVQNTIKTPLNLIGGFQFSATLDYDGAPAQYIFVFGPQGLEAIAIDQSVTLERFQEQTEELKTTYGSPVAQNAKAMQWSDDSNDIGFMLLPSQDRSSGEYSVRLAFRKKSGAAIIQKYGPDKFSVFKGIYLGMSKEEFLQTLSGAIPKKESAEEYSAQITFNLQPANAVFSFADGKLHTIVVEIYPSRLDDATIHSELISHKQFLVQLYGEPTDDKGSAFFWKEEKISMGFGWREGAYMLIFNLTKQ